MRLLVGLGVATAGALIGISTTAGDLDEVPVESLQRVETEALRQAVSSAAEAGESWVYDALQVALSVVGVFEGRSQSITRTYDSADAPRKAEIVVIEDGYLDDSLRGARYQIMLESDAQGVWRPTAVEKAWRCWPGRGHETFGKEPCL